MTDSARPAPTGRAAIAAILAAAALLAAGPAAAAPSLTAEEAMERYRERFVPVAEIDCPTPTDPDEIIVCGRPGAPDPNRLPIPSQRVAGTPIPGEAITEGAALNCLRLCPQPLRIDLIKAVKIGRKIIRHILDPD